jgi:hypothetical protein
MVKNTKAMMNAARMTMVPMPMGANLAEIHPAQHRAGELLKEMAEQGEAVRGRLQRNWQNLAV